MTGSASVSSLPFPALYQAGTLLAMVLFSRYDILHRRVRNTALYAFLPWCLASLLPCTMQYPQPLWTALFRSLLGFLLGGLLFLAVSLLTHGCLGGGDIKLIALLGILYGPYGIILISVSASLTAIAACGVRTVIFRKKIERVPFVPYLCLGCLAAWLLL